MKMHPDVRSARAPAQAAGWPGVRSCGACSFSGASRPWPAQVSSETEMQAQRAQASGFQTSQQPGFYAASLFLKRCLGRRAHTGGLQLCPALRTLWSRDMRRTHVPHLPGPGTASEGQMSFSKLFFPANCLQGCQVVP